MHYLYNNSLQDNIIKKKMISQIFFIFTQEEREKIRDIRNEKKNRR